MHISRQVPLVERRPAPPPTQRGVVAAVIVCVTLSLAGSAWLAQHGATFACGGDDPTLCAGP